MSAKAVFSYKRAYLSSDFGEQFARRYFSDEELNRMGRYVRGARKGKLKGQVGWKKVEAGGWVSDMAECYGGYVETRKGKVIEAWLETAPWGEEPVRQSVWYHGEHAE